MTFEEAEKLNLPGKTVRILFKKGGDKVIQVEGIERPVNGVGPTLIIIGREKDARKEPGPNNGAHCRYHYWPALVERIEILF